MSIGGIYVVLIFSVYIINSCGLENSQPRNTPMLSTNIPSESSPVVSAVLLECPKGLRKNSCKPPKQQQRPPCEQQLMVNIRVNPSFHIEKVEKFLILDEVYDPRKRCKAKIMSPYLIEISRGEPIMMYPLEFTKSVKTEGLKNNDECKKTCNSDRKNNNKSKNRKKIGHKKCNKIDNGNSNDNNDGNDNIKPCPKPDATTCKSDNSDLRTEPKQIEKSNLRKQDNYPQQESLNRVINKISSAFGSITNVSPDSDNRQQPSNKPSQNEKSEKGDSDREKPGNAKMVNNEYDSEDGDDEEQWEQNRQTQDNGKRRESPNDSTNNELLEGSEKIQNSLPSGTNKITSVRGEDFHPESMANVASSSNKVTRDSGEDFQSESMANVGVEESLLKKLEKHGKVAQVGLVRAKADTKLTDLADDGDWSGKIKIRKISPSEMKSEINKHNKDDVSYNEIETSQNEDFDDYSAVPSTQHTDTRQTEEYNDLRIPIHPITKRRKFKKKGKKHKHKTTKKTRTNADEDMGIDDEEEYEEVLSNGRSSKDIPQNMNRGENYQHTKLRTVPNNIRGMEQSTDTGQEEDNINAGPNMQMQEEQNSQMTPFDNRAEDVGANVDMENYEEYQGQERPMNKEEAIVDKQRRSETDNNGGQMNEVKDLPNLQEQRNADVGQLQSNTDNEIKESRRSEVQTNGMGLNTNNLQEQRNADFGQQQSNTDNEPRRLDRNNNVITNPADDVEYNYDEDGNFVRYHTESNRFSKANSRNVPYVQQNRMPYGIGRADDSRGNESPLMSIANNNNAYRKDALFRNMENKYDAQNTDESFMPTNMRKTNGYMNGNNEEPQQESDFAENVVYEPNHDNYRNPISSNINAGRNQNKANAFYNNNKDINEPSSRVMAESGNSELNNEMYNNANNWNNERTMGMHKPSRLHGSVTHYGATPEVNRIYGITEPLEKVQLHYNVVLPPSGGNSGGKNQFAYSSPGHSTNAVQKSSNNLDKGNGFKSLWSFASLPQTNQPVDIANPSSTDKVNGFLNPPAILQPPRSAAMQLLDPEPEKFLPKMTPCGRISDDPNLNIHDKLLAIDTIDPHNKQSDSKFGELSREIELSHITYPNPFPIPFDTVASSNLRKRKDNAKKKRSFVFYDDLEMRDTLLDNDYNFDNTETKPRQTNAPRHAEEDITQCDTCGGKGKKPHGKTEQTGQLNAPDHACHCRNQRGSTDCNCIESKHVRSVSDAWYSVFNMSAPLPFLTTKLNIFRKRHNTWWKIVPSITLNSLSGIFANANLSILFSSHVDIFQLEKSLRLQNHQLLIPKDDRPIRENQNLMQKHYRHNNKNKASFENILPNLNILNIHPETILTVDGRTFNWKDNKRFSRVAQQKDERATQKKCGKSDKNTRIGNTNTQGIRTIGDLGYFPTSMNLLEQCPNDKNRLCLNMLEDRVPAYSIKVKMPFRENDILWPHVFKVKIARIITDATTKDVLQLSVDIINKGLIPHTFSISVNNCPQTCESKTSVKKFLLPNVGETVTFLLPLILDAGQRHKKFTCDLVVKSKDRNIFFDAASSDIARRKRSPINVIEPKKMIVAMRSFTVDPDNRCFCIWDCNCHCIPKLESYINCNKCKKLTHKEQKYAGLLLSCKLNEHGEEKCILDDDDDNDDINKEVNNKKPITEAIPVIHKEILEEEEDGICLFMHYALMLLGIMLLLGLIKALIGLCSKRVDRYGYVYVQPGHNYDDASRCRRFFVNVVFFIVFPFLFWCTCFRPSEEDLLVASTEWQCSVAQGPYSDGDSGGDYGRGHYKGCRSTEDDEEIILTQKHLDRGSKACNTHDRLTGGQEIGLNNRLTDWSLAFHDGIFDDDDDADEEANTKFVLQALVESRESLKKLLNNRPGQTYNAVPEEEDPRYKEAAAIVHALKSAQIVYRIFNQPIGNVRNLPAGTKYCVQGYFLPSLGTEYEFVNYNPLAQHRCISKDGKSFEILRPPVILCPKEFSRIYANKIAVLEAGDLSIQPPPGTPCINVSTMAFVASSVVKLASEHSFQGCTPQLPQPKKASTNSMSSSRFQKQQYHLDEATAEDRRKLSHHEYSVSLLNEVDEEEKVEDEIRFFIENISPESTSEQRIDEPFQDDSSSL